MIWWFIRFIGRYFKIIYQWHLRISPLSIVIIISLGASSLGRRCHHDLWGFLQKNYIIQMCQQKWIRFCKIYSWNMFYCIKNSLSSLHNTYKNQFWVSCFKFSFVPDIRAKLFWNHNPYLCYLVQGFSLCIIPKFLEIIYRELRVLNSLMNYASNTFVLIDFTIACFIFGIFQVRFYRFQIDFYFMALQLQMGSGNFTVLRFKLTLHYRFTTSVRFYRLYR